MKRGNNEVNEKVIEKPITKLNITEEDALAIIGYLQRKKDQK